MTKKGDSYHDSKQIEAHFNHMTFGARQTTDIL